MNISLPALRLISILSLCLLLTNVNGQDSCSVAVPFPALGAGVTACESGTTVGMTAEIPYTYQSNCVSGGVMPSPATDVWYSFVAVGNLLDVNITNSTMTDVVVGLYEGTCAGLIGRGCETATGASLSVTFAPLVAGTTYYIQVSGGSAADVGTFDLCIRSYDDLSVVCIQEVSVTATPPPSNGTYGPGQTVDFCVTVNGYNQLAADWFHGLVPAFGSAWDAGSITNFTFPASVDGDGTWNWYSSVTGTAGSAIGPTGPGFFYDSGAGGPLDGNAGNNYGDACGAGCSWTFCWSITTVASCPPGVDGDDLSVLLENYSDSETGSWNSSSTCPSDPDYLFNAVLSCCPPPTVTTVEPACPGLSTGSITAVGDGIAPFTFDWSTGFSEVSQDSSTIENLSAGAYSVTVTDNAGCVTVSNVTINEPPPITPVVTDQVNIMCEGATNGSVSFTTNGGVSPYQYSFNGGPLQADSVFTGLAAGSYTIDVTDASGCSGTGTINIIEENLFTGILINSTDETCEGDNDGSLEVSATGGYPAYSYSIDGTNFQNSGSFTGLAPGNYTVTLQDDSNCVFTIDVTINAGAAVVANATATPSEIAVGTSTTLEVTSPSNIASTSWAPTETLECPTCPSTTATPLTTTTYIVTITDDNGCEDTASVTVTVLELDLAVPNAFSPNGDNNNDVFEIINTLASEFDMKIYNRWGDEVFHSTDLSIGWDGTYKGKEQEIGSYIYVIRLVTIEGKEFNKKGNVTLLR